MKESPYFYRYIEEFDIHYLDYRTYITMEIGLERLEQLEEYFSSLDTSTGIIKVLMDARNFTYDSEDTHLSMSRFGRKLFFTKYENFKLAILNDSHELHISENEAWFLNEESAIEWLKDKT